MLISYLANQLNETFPFFSPFIILFSIAFMLSSCSSSSNHNEEMKFNPALNQKIRDAEQNNPQEVIPVLIKSSEKLTSEMRAEIEKTELVVESVIGEIFIANGTAKQIRETARLPYILNLELSQKSTIK